MGRAAVLPLVMAMMMQAPAGQADVLVSTRTLRAQSIVSPEDIRPMPGQAEGALENPAEAIGQEVRNTIYAGRPVLASDLAAPALVDRNQIVTLIYRSGPLTIQAEGRALARGGLGDTLRVMNTLSRTTVMGTITPDGAVLVGAGR